MFNSDRIEALEDSLGELRGVVRDQNSALRTRVRELEDQNTDLLARMSVREQAGNLVARTMVGVTREISRLKDYAAQSSAYLSNENEFVGGISADLERVFEAVNLLADKLGVKVVTEEAIPSRIEFVPGAPERLALEKAPKHKNVAEDIREPKLLAELPDGTFKIRVERVVDGTFPGAD